ncbi:MAG: PLP-dependent aminotransferase family protein [Bacteroidota bacterium]
MLPYNNIIQLDRQSTTPVFLQLTNELVKLIQNGQLTPNTKLPSSRMLAMLLQLNRNTVTKSLEELEALGWVNILPKKGTFVVDTFPQIRPNKWSSEPNTNLESVAPSFNFYDFPALKKPVAFDYSVGFDDGLPDVRLAPIDELAKGYARNIRQLAFETDLNYKDGLGNLALRQQLVKLLNETRGLNITVDHILITRGTVMAIHLAVAACVKKGDLVAVGATNYQTADMIIRHFGGQIVRIPVDEKGLQVAKLAEICATQTIRAVYVTSHHHHPTTVTLSPERRIALLDLSHQHNFVILEDDYDYDFHYDNSPVLPLASANQSGSVLYFGSFTKVLAPAFRVGYLVGPPNLIEVLPKLRRIFDRQGDTILEKTIADLLQDGTIRRHLKKSWQRYKLRRNFCCDLLEKEVGDWVTFDKPTGGMAIWAQFAPRISIPQLSKKMIAKGVYLADGSTYNPAGQQLNAVRMGFASLNLREIDHCVETLKRVIAG